MRCSECWITSPTLITPALWNQQTRIYLFFWAQCVDSSGMFISFFVMLGKIIYRVLLLRSHEYGAWAKCYSHSEVEELKKNYFHLIPEKQSRYVGTSLPSRWATTNSQWAVVDDCTLRFDVRWLEVWVIFPHSCREQWSLSPCWPAVNMQERTVFKKKCYRYTMNTHLLDKHVLFPVTALQ